MSAYDFALNPNTLTGFPFPELDPTPPLVAYAMNPVEWWLQQSTQGEAIPGTPVTGPTYPQAQQNFQAQSDAIASAAAKLNPLGWLTSPTFFLAIIGIGLVLLGVAGFIF